MQDEILQLIIQKASNESIAILIALYLLIRLEKFNTRLSRLEGMVKTLLNHLGSDNNDQDRQQAD